MWRTQKMDFRARLPSPSLLSLPWDVTAGTGQALARSPGEMGSGVGGQFLMKSIWSEENGSVHLYSRMKQTKKDTWIRSFRMKGRPWFHVTCHVLPKLWSHYFVDIQPDRCRHPTWDGPTHTSPKGPEGKCKGGLGPRVTGSQQSACCLCFPFCFVEEDASWGASLVTQMVKNLPAMQVAQFRSLDQKHTLEKRMTTHCSILAWRIPTTLEPGRLHTVHRVTKSCRQLSD